MSDLTTGPTRFVGCDVGKLEIVVFDSKTACTRRVPNEPRALAAFAAALTPTALVICEATGGYEAALLDALVEAGRPAHRADARKVKAFIRSLGTLGKTDAIDARALARYGQERHDRLTPWRPRQAARDCTRSSRHAPTLSSNGSPSPTGSLPPAPRQSPRVCTACGPQSRSRSPGSRPISPP
jgi:transposase